MPTSDIPNLYYPEYNMISIKLNFNFFLDFYSSLMLTFKNFITEPSHKAPLMSVT